MADSEKTRLQFTKDLIKLLQELKEKHATEKDGWFAINQLYLSFAGRCEDADLRVEMLKLVKMLTDSIPLEEEEASKKLDRPVSNLGPLDISKMIAKVQGNRKINPKDIK